MPHPLKRVCIVQGIAHRLTQVGHPWSNGQVERMNGLLKSATVKRYNHATDQTLKEDLHSFVLAYNHAKKLKDPKGLTPYEIYPCYLGKRT